MQEGVFITPQEAMEPVLNETLIDHESRPSLKAVKSSLAFHNDQVTAESVHAAHIRTKRPVHASRPVTAESVHAAHID